MIKPLVRIVTLFCFVLCGNAQNHFTVHGHWIGETADSFLKSNPEVLANLAACHDIVAHPDAWVKKDPRYKPYGSTIQNPSPSEKKILDDSDKEQAGDVANDILFDHSCSKLTSAFDAREASASLVYQPEIDGGPRRALQWMFAGGVLTGINLQVPTEQYEDIVADINSRTGVSPTEGTTAMQNSYGAAWKDRTARWLTPEVYVDLKQSNDPHDPRVVLIVESRADYDKQLSELRSKPGPLD